MRTLECHDSCCQTTLPASSDSSTLPARLCDAVCRGTAGGGARTRGERRAPASDAAGAAGAVADRRRAAGAGRVSARQSGRCRRAAEGAGRAAHLSRPTCRRKAAFAAGDAAARAVEMRVSTFPTLHGERAVVRLFAGGAAASAPGRPGAARRDRSGPARGCCVETSGAILLTGPAGSGKTTTAYACLRDIVRGSQGRRSVVTLEDPIEMALAGVSQSQVQPAAGFTLATGLRSLMRQDPEVILVGEIRDARNGRDGVSGVAHGAPGPQHVPRRQRRRRRSAG